MYIATYVDVQPPSTNQGIEVIHQYREAGRRGEGNLGLDAVQEISRPNRFTIVEVWKDQSSFEQHQKASRIVQLWARLGMIHNSPYDRRLHLAFSIDASAAATSADAIFVVTHVDVPPPRKDEAEVLLKALAEESREDPGHLRYDIFQQIAPRTNHFTVFAVWKDANAFDSHQMTPHTRKFREGLGPLLGAPYDERLYKAVP